MVTLTPLVFVSKLLVLAIGILIVRSAYRAYRRTGSRSLRALTIAFGLITVGSVLGGSVHRLLNVGLEAGVLVNTALTAVGFAVLAYSLYVTEEPPIAA